MGITNQHPNHTNQHPNHTTWDTIAVIVLLVSASCAVPQNFFRPQNQNQRQFEPQAAPVDSDYEEIQDDFVEPLGLSSGALNSLEILTPHSHVTVGFTATTLTRSWTAISSTCVSQSHMLMDPRRPSSITSSVLTPPCSISPSSPASMSTSPFPAQRLRTSSSSMKISVLSPGMNLNNYKYYLLHCPKK